MEFWTQHARNLSRALRTYPQLTKEFVRTATPDELAPYGLRDLPRNPRDMSSVESAQSELWREA